MQGRRTRVVAPVGLMVSLALFVTFLVLVTPRWLALTVLSAALAVAGIVTVTWLVQRRSMPGARLRNTASVPAPVEPGSARGVRCDRCERPIFVGHAVWYLAPERQLVHQRCPQTSRAPGLERPAEGARTERPSREARPA